MLDANGLPIEGEAAEPTEEAPAEEQAHASSSRSSSRKKKRGPSVDTNCVGELAQLPNIEGTAYQEYQCKDCGQVVHVGLEELETNGLPEEHHRREEEK